MNEHVPTPEPTPEGPSPTPEIPRQKAVDVFFGDKFTKTLFKPARHKALFGGRGSGKSYSVATYLIIEACKARRRVVCARQFQNSIRDSSKELLEKRIRDLNLSEQFTITERTIVHNGTQSDFLFIGLERNIESIRSLEGADVVWVEEARTTNAKSLEVLLPTVRKAGSQFIWTWNPEQPDDPVDYYFRGPQGPPPNSIVTEVNYKDNPFFFGTELSNEMETLKRGNPDRFRHVWEGAYDLRHESKVFPQARVGQVAVDPDEMPPRYGMDFGFGMDPSFIVKLYINENRKQIYIEREACGRIPMDDLPNLARQVIDSDRDVIYADSSQPGTIEFLRRRGLNVVQARKGPGSVKSGINFLQGYDIVIDPSCERLRDEARLYSWQMDRLTGKILNIPVDANNHGWDSCIKEGELVTTARGDIPIEDVNAGNLVLTRSGYNQVNQNAHMGIKDILEVSAGGRSLRLTPDHRVWTENRGWQRADALGDGDELLLCRNSNPTSELKQSPSMATSSGAIQTASAWKTGSITDALASCCIALSGLFTTDLSRRGIIFTTGTSTITTTILQTLSAFLLRNISPATAKPSLCAPRVLASVPISTGYGRFPHPGIPARKDWSFTATLADWLIETSSRSRSNARSAMPFSTPGQWDISTGSVAMPASRHGVEPAESMAKIDNASSVHQSSELINIPAPRLVRAPVHSVRVTGKTANVYDLSVNGAPEFFASGILVHNCRYAVEDLSLDGGDALFDPHGGVFKLW